MKRADINLVVEYLDREAAFMDRQACDVVRLAGTPDETSDNQDRAAILRHKAEVFRKVSNILAAKDKR